MPVVPVDKSREISGAACARSKEAHGLPPDFEVKWSKGFASRKQGFYRDYLDFFDDDDLHFRAWVADKAGLAHSDFRQSHDDWYYKDAVRLAGAMIRPDARFRIYRQERTRAAPQSMVKAS